MKKQLFVLNKKKYNFIKNKAIILFMALFVSCTSDMERIKTITSISGLPTQSAKNIKIINTDSARISMIVYANELNTFDKAEEPYTEFTKGLKVDFYDEAGNVDGKMTANYAKRNDKTAIWEAQNDVVAVARDGKILNTELLYWDEDKEIIYTDKFVKVTEGESIIYGTGFEADQNFDSYTIKNISGTIYTDE